VRGDVVVYGANGFADLLLLLDGGVDLPGRLEKHYIITSRATM
jgi:glycine/D-amino acid oxidase-like deaminating enzyme